MENTKTKNGLEITLDTNVQDLLRTEEHIDGRVTGFLNILYKVGKIKTLGDVPKLNDIDVFLVNQFSEISLKRLNRLLHKYSIPPLKTDMDKKTMASYRRRVDMERKRIVEERGMPNEYRLSIIGFDYAPHRCIFR